MGGHGSGRWGERTEKHTVEDCLWLDANGWMREGFLQAGIRLDGALEWRQAFTGAVSSLGVTVDTTDMRSPWVRLCYQHTSIWTPTPKSIDYRIGLHTTRPCYGGLRWWFACPLLVGGSVCGRRVGKLYLPPGERYFGCRHCHDLTYTSCQEGDNRESLLHMLGLKTLME